MAITSASTRSRTPVDTVARPRVWDDPVNLMSYVTAVFREYFGYSTSRAEELMMLTGSSHTTVRQRGTEVEASCVRGTGWTIMLICQP